MLSFPKIDAQRGLEIRDRKGKAFLLISLSLESYPKQNMIHAQFHDPQALWAGAGGGIRSHPATLSRRDFFGGGTLPHGGWFGPGLWGWGKRSDLQHSPGLYREPITPEGLHISPHCWAATDFSHSRQILLYFGRMISKQSVFAQNSPCLFTRINNLLMENLHKGSLLRMRLVHAAERIPRRCQGRCAQCLPSLGM